MADGYEKCTQAQGRIPFGLRHIKLLIGVMHWVQDQDHCYRNASTGDIADANEFSEIIDISIQRTALRKVEDDQVDTISKAADPGKFKDERKWSDWEPAFVNYLSMIPGSYHVPLSYVVREQEDPDHDRDFGDDFVSEMITCAPLSGLTQDVFTSYSRTTWWRRRRSSGSRTWNLMQTAAETYSPYESITVERATQVGTLQLPNE